MADNNSVRPGDVSDTGEGINVKDLLHLSDVVDGRSSATANSNLYDINEDSTISQQDADDLYDILRGDKPALLMQSRELNSDGYTTKNKMTDFFKSKIGMVIKIWWPWVMYLSMRMYIGFMKILLMHLMKMNPGWFCDHPLLITTRLKKTLM